MLTNWHLYDGQSPQWATVPHHILFEISWKTQDISKTLLAIFGRNFGLAHGTFTIEKHRYPGIYGTAKISYMACVKVMQQHIGVERDQGNF